MREVKEARLNNKQTKMDIQKAKEDDLFLRTQLGEGKMGDEEFCLTIASNGSFLMVELEEEKYIVNLRSVVEDVFKFRDKEKKTLKKTKQ